MEKWSFLLPFLLLSFISFSQTGERKVSDTSRKEEASLVFIFQNNQYYYTLPQENRKTKLDSLTSLPVHRVIDSALAKNNKAPKDLMVIIEGDGVMNDSNFQTLLETLLDKKIYQVRIRTSLYE